VVVSNSLDSHIRVWSADSGGLVKQIEAGPGTSQKIYPILFDIPSFTIYPIVQFQLLWIRPSIVIRL
jgi:hypothetical protein